MLLDANAIFIYDSNGMLGPGATVTLFCFGGFMPTEPVTAICLDSLTWDPDPKMLVCSPGEEGCACMKSFS